MRNVVPHKYVFPALPSKKFLAQWPNYFQNNAILGLQRDLIVKLGHISTGLHCSKSKGKHSSVAFVFAYYMDKLCNVN